MARDVLPGLLSMDAFWNGSQVKGTSALQLFRVENMTKIYTK